MDRVIIKRFFAFGLIWMMLAGCAPKVTPIKIGVIEPLSGEYAAGGQLEYQGVQEALEEQAQVGGRPVELVTVDNTSTVEGAKRAAQALADADVSIVIGSWGSVLSAAAAPIFEKHKIPAVATTAVVYENDSYFSLGFSEAWQGAALAALAAENGWDRVAVIYDRESAYDVAIRNAFIEAASEESICAEAYVDGNMTDCVAAMEQEQADALLIPSLADEAQTALPVMGGDICRSESVYHAVYGEVKDVGYDGYLVALAVLEGATEVTGRTGRFRIEKGQLIRTEYWMQTPNGAEKKKFS